jgi:hypothetical protein
MPNGLVTTQRFARIASLPISLPQTQLNAGMLIVAMKITLAMHQRLELRSLNCFLASILTPGAIPTYLNTAMGLCSVCVTRSLTVCSPLAYALVKDTSTTSNPFSLCAIETPGVYNVIVSNNTSNVDMAVTATGLFKLYT